MRYEVGHRDAPHIKKAEMGYSKRPAVMKGPFVHESESVCECKQPRA